jgi:class 3 adenylate cyclase
VKTFHGFFYSLLQNIVVLILVAALVTLFVMYQNLRSTVDNMSTIMIQDRLDLTAQELSNIFDPINQELEKLSSQGKKGLFPNIKDQQQLNKIFMPLVKHSPSVSSIMLANEQGDEYMLLNSDSVWITRITTCGSEKNPPINYIWQENPSGEDRILTSAEHNTMYDPRARPWYKLALENEADAYSWTSPYTFFTTKEPGITASTRWIEKTTAQNYTIGLDVLISDLSEFSTTIDITENGKVIILTDDYRVIGLPKDPKFIEPESRTHYILKKLPELDLPVLNAAIEQIQNGNEQNRYHSFVFDNENWWAGFEEYNLGISNNFIIAVVVPESDFSKQIKETRQLLIGGFIMITLFFLIILYSYVKLKKANSIIASEKDKNEKLLLNTLPIKVVNDLKKNGKSEPQKFRNVTVCFSDIVGFTQASSVLDPKELINELNDIYTAFDEIMIKYDCERIKTIGDAYLAVCGMPQQNIHHAEMMLKAAIDIISYTRKRSQQSSLDWQIRIGLHSGNVVGGIVGIKKYIYDVFGDTINTASRMESNSTPMRVNISAQTYELVKDTDFVKNNDISFEKRKLVNVKGKGSMEMYFVVEGR